MFLDSDSDALISTLFWFRILSQKSDFRVQNKPAEVSAKRLLAELCLRDMCRGPVVWSNKENASCFVGMVKTFHLGIMNRIHQKAQKNRKVLPSTAHSMLVGMRMVANNQLLLLNDQQLSRVVGDACKAVKARRNTVCNRIFDMVPVLGKRWLQEDLRALKRIGQNRIGRMVSHKVRLVGGMWYAMS